MRSRFAVKTARVMLPLPLIRGLLSASQSSRGRARQSAWFMRASCGGALSMIPGRYRSKILGGLRPARIMASVLTSPSLSRARRTRRRASQFPQKGCAQWSFAKMRFGKGFLREPTGLRPKAQTRPSTGKSCATSPGLHTVERASDRGPQVKRLAPGSAGRYKSVHGQRDSYQSVDAVWP